MTTAEKNTIATQETQTSPASSAEGRTIYDESLPKGQITIFETTDKDRAYLKITSTTSDEQFTKDEILEITNEIGIKSEINEKKIEEALTSLQNQGDAVKTMKITEGEPRIDGKDGACEILFTQEDPYVEQDEMVLRITDPTEGTPGRDIYGNEIPAKKGIKPVITLGENVIKKNPSEYFSQYTGKVSFANNVLSIRKILEIKVSEDKMSATLTYIGATKLTYTKIMDEINEKGIKFGVAEDTIDSIIASFEEEVKNIEDIVIVLGIKPQKGRDGEVKYSFIIDTDDNPHFKEKKDGSIDIRETNTVQTVNEGDEIATITPHIPSQNGKDIFGKTYQVPKVKEVALKSDKGVRSTADGLHFFAEISGRPILEADRLGLKISVNEVFTVDGDLDLKIGNIDFNGVVEIGGDVEDGFSVKATKSIFIGGSIGACNIEAGTDLTIQGGCNGKEQANLYAGGNIEVRYLNETKVKSRGNILVKNEIVNSEIHTLGRVTVQSGSIRGGKIFAKMGIESYDIGSEMGVKTILVPGADYELTAECKNIDTRIIEINKDLDDINKRIAPLLKNKELLPKLPEKQREKLKETIDYLSTIKDEKNSLNETKSSLINQSRENAIQETVAHNIVYHSVILKIYDSRREVASMLEGPLRLYEEDERIIVEPYGDKARKRTEDKMTKEAKKQEDAAKEAADAKKKDAPPETPIEKETEDDDSISS